MFYNQSVIENLRQNLDIIDVISPFVKLKKNGNNYVGLCPFHNEKSPSFSISRDKQLYHCFGCGASGNVYTFIMEYERLTFYESIEYLARTINFQLPTEDNKNYNNYELKDKLFLIHKDIAILYMENLDNNSIAMEYLKNRGLDNNIINRFAIGYADNTDIYSYLKEKGYSEKEINESGLVIESKNGGYFNRFKDRIMFPIINEQNRVIGFGGRIITNAKNTAKYLNSPTTPIFNKSFNLYGLNFSKKTKERNFILVEGYMDVISLFSYGFTNAIASLGTAFNENHIRTIRKYTKEIILLFDSDEAGIKASKKAIELFRKTDISIYVVSLKDYKDPDEFLKAKGAEEFKKVLATKMSGIRFLILEEMTHYNLEDVNEKIRFTKLCADIIGTENNKIAREAYVSTVSNLTGISKEAIFENLSPTIKEEKTNKREITSSQFNERGVKTLISLFIKNKNIYLKVKDFLNDDDFVLETYVKLIKVIDDLYDNNDLIKEGEVINYFEEAKDQRRVSEIFNTSLVFDDDDNMEKIVNDLVRTIKNESLERKINNTSDIGELQNLLKEKKKLIHIKIF